MFKFESANPYGMGQGWQRYRRNSDPKVLYEIVKKQTHGKRPYKTIGECANALTNYDVSIFLDKNGNPAVYVVTHNEETLINIWGCETSGAVEPKYSIVIAEAINQDSNFAYQALADIQKLIDEGKELDAHQKLIVQTFFPPDARQKVENRSAGPVGGGMSFGAPSTASRPSGLVGKDEKPDQKNKKQNEENDDEQEQKVKNKKEKAKTEEELLKQAEQAQRIEVLTLVVLIENNLRLNCEQIRLILEQVENGGSVEQNGRMISVADKMTLETAEQIKNFFDAEENAEYIKEHKLKQGPKFKNIYARLEKEAAAKRKKEEQVEKDADFKKERKTPQQENEAQEYESNSQSKKSNKNASRPFEPFKDELELLLDKAAKNRDGRLAEPRTKETEPIIPPLNTLTIVDSNDSLKSYGKVRGEEYQRGK